RAFADWALGSPKIAALDIRFITDPNTILANLLAGETDVTGLPWLAPAQAASGRDQWLGAGLGQIHVTESRLEYMEFQFREVPNWPSALTDLRVRQALLHALDRKGLSDTLNESLGGSPAD